MPLTGRVIGPTRICQIAHITGNANSELAPSLNTHNLEETTYITLVGVMKQLCDVATYADEIFTNLYSLAKDTVDRTDKLHKKVTHLNECLLTVCEPDDSDMIDKNGPGMVLKKQSLFNRDTRPSDVKDKFKETEKTPPLHEFLDFMTVDDRSIQPHKLYSDPTLFFTAWMDLMEKESQQFKKARKRSFKKMKDSQISKIATLKKKVHDPKSKTFIMVDIEPQYATLGAARSAPDMPPVSATLNRKKYGNVSSDVTLPSVTSPASSGSYTSPEQQSFDQNGYRECSTPIRHETQQPREPVVSPQYVESPSGVEIQLTGDNLNTSLPPPPPDLQDAPPPPQDLPLPSPPPASPPHGDEMSPPPPPPDLSPPPVLPPPVPEDAIKPVKLTEKQRILRTNEVVEVRGRETLLDMIRSSSFNLKPVPLKQLNKQSGAVEPTYVSFGGRDVASILQRRKYLMGAGDHSDYSSGSESDGEGWD